MSSTHHARPLPILVAFVVCCSPFVGCTAVPKNGALLSVSLTEGIQRNQLETEKLIAALAATQRAILDARWDELYIETEAAWLRENQLSEGAKLTQEQRSSIAANMSRIWEELSDAIDAKEAALIASSRANTAQLLATSEAIRKYLLSVEKLEVSRTDVVQRVSSLTGIDVSDLNSLTERLLDNASP